MPMLTAILFVLSLLTPTRPILSGTTTLALDFPAGYTYASFEFKSLDQPGYVPTKSYNFAPTTVHVETDWTMVNCTLDDMGREHPLCPDGKEWDVRGIVDSADGRSKAFSNTLRLIFR